MKTHCPNCEYGRVEMEVRRTRGGDFITAWDECPTCKGEGEINQRNTIEEIKVVSGYIFIYRIHNAAIYDTTNHKRSSKRLERILTDLVNEGQYDVVYEELTRGVVTFHPAQLPY